MTKPPVLQAVTANDLLEGDVVYLTAAHGWSRALMDAAIAGSNEEAERLLAVAVPQEATVVGPYLIEISRNSDGTLEPVHYRERIRTLGPSNRPDLGRQAESASSSHPSQQLTVRQQESAHVSL